MSEIENDGVVPEGAAYGVGSSMPGDEHVADGRVGARTVGAEADVVVVIVRLPPPPQPTRTGGPCYRVAANLWFLLLRAAARPRDSRVSEPQPQHRRLLPATQEASLRQMPRADTVTAATAGELRWAHAVPGPAGTLQAEKQGNRLAVPISAGGEALRGRGGARAPGRTSENARAPAATASTTDQIAPCRSL